VILLKIKSGYLIPLLKIAKDFLSHCQRAYNEWLHGCLASECIWPIWSWHWLTFTSSFPHCGYIVLLDSSNSLRTLQLQDLYSGHFVVLFLTLLLSETFPEFKIYHLLPALSSQHLKIFPPQILWIYNIFLFFIFAFHPFLSPYSPPAKCFMNARIFIFSPMLLYPKWGEQYLACKSALKNFH
jgi:hypothetical protein